MFYKPSVNWAIIAFALRLIMGLASHIYSLEIGRQGYVPLPSYGDDELYWKVSNEISLGIEPEYIPNFYPLFIGVIFAFTGADMLIGKIINIIASSLTVYFGVLITRSLCISLKLPIIKQKYSANITGLLMTLYPSAAFFSSQLIKDPLLVFFATVNLYVSVLILTRKQNIILWHSWVFSLLLTYLFREYTAISLVLCILCYIIFIWKTQAYKKIGLVIISLVLICFVPYFVGQGFFASNYWIGILDVEKFSEFRESGFSQGNTALDVTLDFSNPISFIFTYYLSFMNTMFGPFPWQLKAIIQFVALPETFFIWILAARVIKIIINKNLSPHTDTPYENIILVFTIVLIGTIAFANDNFAANVRLRQLPWNTFIIYSSIIIAKNKTQKRIFWNHSIAQS